MGTFGTPLNFALEVGAPLVSLIVQPRFKMGMEAKASGK